MGAWMPAGLVGGACVLVLLWARALQPRACPPSMRDDAWRDRLPLVLRALRPLLRRYARSVAATMTASQREVLQSRLDAAGASYWITPAELVVLRRLACAGGLLMAFYVMWLLDLRDPLYIGLAACLVPFAYCYPDIWLRDARERRRASFEKEFPFFLDVVVLAMRAGLTFAAAVEQAVEQLRAGAAREEFARYLRETRAGVTRRAALDRLAARVMIPAVTSFVASVTQAEETGASLGDVLADQARQRRQERFVRAEKMASRAPVKMLFPLIALLFPTTFIILGFPIVVQLVEAGVLDIFPR